MALFLYLLALALALPRAYVDRDEPEESRRARIGELVGGVVDAIESAGLDDERARAYGVTLIVLAHRETVLARRPRDVGNEDQGLAHGPWQIHEWKGKNPFAASTALEMLREDPWQSWCLPKGAPWVGLPRAARYLVAHPALPPVAPPDRSFPLLL